MRSIIRRLLTLYLACCIALSPLFPALAHAQPGTTPWQLPELGSTVAPFTAKPTHDQQAAQWLWAADTNGTFTDKALASAAVRDRTGGADEAVQRAGGALTGAASGASEQWFGSHGITSALALGAGRNGVKNGSLDLLMPFYKAGNSLIFTQAGVRRANTYTEDYRNTVNLGLGYRHDAGNWLLGLNGFFDRDLTGKNDRLGVGLEAWTDFLKLSANTYQPLSGWNAAPDLDNYIERPARGWDVRAEGYLPAYPQLGGKLAYEQYYGDEVALLSGADRRKDPNALTLGVIYNPVPLVGVNVNHRYGQGGQTDTSANLTLTYRLGEPLVRQLSSDNLMASRLLERMRHDLVSRNNEMVLDVRKDLTELRLAAVISGTENTPVPLQLTGAEALQSLTWTGSAAGFILSTTLKPQMLLQLPAYNATGTNTYSLQASGVDRAGRRVTSNLMTVIVLSVGVAVVASPVSIQANGTDTTTLSATVSNAQGQPVGAGHNVVWATTAGQLTSNTSSTDANGIATMVLTSSTTSGVATVRATANAASATIAVAFAPGAAAALTLTPATAIITANGTSTTSLSASVEDANGNSIGAGVSVNWTTSAGTLASPTSTTDANGVATVELTSSTTAGTATVLATSGTASGSATVIYSADIPARITLTPAAALIPADGVTNTTLSARLEDANGNAMGAGQTVSWSTTVGTLSSNTSTTDATGTATVTLTSANTPGVANVTARVGNVQSVADVTFGVGPPARMVLNASATIVNVFEEVTITASVADAQGNPVGAGLAVTCEFDGGGVVVPTDANGVAVCTVSRSVPGSLIVRVTAGTISEFIAIQVE